MNSHIKNDVLNLQKMTNDSQITNKISKALIITKKWVWMNYYD